MNAIIYESEQRLTRRLSVTIAAIIFLKFTWYYTSAGLATRFRTRTHARVIGDNVCENDLCHVVPVELRPRLTSRITNFDRTPIVFVSIIDVNKSAYLLAVRNFHQFLSPTWCEVTFIKSSHYMYVRTYIQIYSILVGTLDLIIKMVSPLFIYSLSRGRNLKIIAYNTKYKSFCLRENFRD